MLISSISSLVLSSLATYGLIRCGGLSADVPNARSSHVHVTPRGGGLAVGIAASIALVLVLLEQGQQQDYGLLALAGFAALVLGTLEDRRGVSAKLRLGSELVLAFAFCWLLGGWTTLISWAGTSLVLPSILALAFSSVWIAWSMNYFNFMDGINGIAALQAISVFSCFAAIAYALDEFALCSINAAIALAAAGFLPFNFPKARIFMGDSGSLFLGFLLAAVPLLLHAASKGRFSFFASILPVAPFLLDSTITLLRRILRRERISEAHRSHCYQQWSIKLGGHKEVSLAYFLLSAVGGFCSYAVSVWEAPLWTLLALGYMLILAGVFAYVQLLYAKRQSA